MKPTPRFDLIVLAASADGVKAIGQVISSLPQDWTVPVAIVQHRAAVTPNRLPEVLGRRTRLKVKLAEPGEPLRAGTVYLASPDRHLVLLADRTFGSHDGMRIRHVLSSANPLLSSASEVLRERLIAVVLTGSGSDATDGVQAVRSGGGIVIAQDPLTSGFAGMPAAAIASGAVTHVLPLDEIGPALCRLVRDGDPSRASGEDSLDSDSAEGKPAQEPRR